ncbi:hypothetical protein ACFX2I_038787 [Malus domestica]
MLHLFLTVLPYLIFTIFIIKRLWSTTISLKHLLPSPPRLPILGNLHQLGTYPHRSLQRLAQRYGELMVLHFGERPVLIVSSADAACEIMKTNDSIFANRPRSTIADRLLYDATSVSSAPYCEYWRQVRGICVVQLLNSTRIQSFRAVREEELALLRIRGEAARKFKKLLEEFMILLGGFYVGDFIPRLGWISRVNGLDTRVKKVAREFDEFLDSVVVGEDKKDLVDVLLEIQKQNTAGFSIDRDSIKGIILVSLFPVSTTPC